jgi:hypothetical protein
MVPQDRFAPSRNGKSEAILPPSPNELLEQFKRIEEAWKKAEEKLASTHVPIDVRIKVDEDYDMEPDGGPIGKQEVFLNYCKAKGARRICLVNRYIEFPADGSYREESTPITECPVDQRLEMFDHFEKLYDHCKAVADSYVPKIKERVDQFEKSLEMIGISLF